MRYYEPNPEMIVFGAIVRLRSGGPDMLVVDIKETKPSAVWCAWPDVHGEIIEGPFFVTSLLRAVN